MKRIICAAAVLALLVTPGASASPWLKSVAAAQKAATAKKSYIFVDLWADWCGWCKRFEQEVAPSEAFQKVTDDMVLLRLNTEDGKEGTQFAQRYQATRLPMFLLLNHDLTIAGAIRGFAPAAQFSAMVQQTIDNDKKFLALVKKEPKLGSDYASLFEIAKGYKERQNYTQSEARFKKLATTKGVPVGIRDTAYFELANMYYEQAKFPQTLTTVNDFRKVQMVGEPFEQALLTAANAYIQQGNTAAAVTELKNFKTRFPNSKFKGNVDSILPMLESQIRR